MTNDEVFAMARLYGLTMQKHKTPTVFGQRVERHRKQLAESLKIGTEPQCGKTSG